MQSLDEIAPTNFRFVTTKARNFNADLWQIKNSSRRIVLVITQSFGKLSDKKSSQ